MRNLGAMLFNSAKFLSLLAGGGPGGFGRIVLSNQLAGLKEAGHNECLCIRRLPLQQLTKIQPGSSGNSGTLSRSCSAAIISS